MKKVFEVLSICFMFLCFANVASAETNYWIVTSVYRDEVTPVLRIVTTPNEDAPSFTSNNEPVTVITGPYKEKFEVLDACTQKAYEMRKKNKILKNYCSQISAGK